MIGTPAGLTVPAGDLGGTNASPTVLQVHPAGATSEVSATYLGLATDGSTDNASKIQTALNSGYSIYLDQAIWYVCASAISLKFHGQYIRGVNSLFGLKFTNDTNGVQGILPYAAGAINGASGANPLSNLTILGPGTYTSSTGLFTGSTGFGIAFHNVAETWNGSVWSGGVFAGDFLSGSHLRLLGWGFAGYINGFGNLDYEDLDVEYNGRGLWVGDSTGNGSKINGITVANNATSGLEINSGNGWDIFVKDCNADAASTTVQIKLNGGGGTIVGANNEGISSTGPVMAIAGNLVWGLTGWTFTKGSGADNPPVTVGSSAKVYFIGCKSGGFSTSPMVSQASDNGGTTGFYTGVTVKTNGQTCAITPFETITDTGIPTATAANRGRPVFVASTSNGADDIQFSVQTGAATYAMLSVNPKSLLTLANTWGANQTIGSSKYLIIPSAGGSMPNLAGGMQLGGSNWKLHPEPILGSDFGFIYATTKARLFYDGTANRFHAGFNTDNTAPTGTMTINLYGTIYTPNLPTTDPHVAGEQWTNSLIMTLSGG